jgi:hypothetical protein
MRWLIVACALLLLVTLHKASVITAQKAETASAVADNRRCFALLSEAQAGPSGVLFRRPRYGGRRT